MKPFDIEKAKAGHPVCTRNGRKARILCYDRDNRELRCIVALVTEPTGLEEIYTYTLKGQISRNEETNHDLMMAPERKTGWINIYPYQCEDKVAMIGYAYKTQKDAEECARGTNCVATIPIEWEE